MSDCDCEIKDVQEVVIEEPEVVKVEKPPRAPRKPSAYNLFVKENMSKLSNIPAKERMKKLGEMWKEQKEAESKPKAKKTTKPKASKPKAKAKKSKE